MEILLPLREANLLRNRMREILALSGPFLKGRQRETVHDLRVASRRLRDLLDYLQSSLPERWLGRSRRMTAKVTKALGGVRESEANLKILRARYSEKRNDAAALELMIQSQRQIMRENRRSALKRVSRKKFERFEKLLSQVKGSRAMESLPSKSVDVRLAEFVSFEWELAVDDAALHGLRIRSKKLRYALEIYNTLHSKDDLAFPIQSIRELQEVLGKIHDFAVLELAVEEEKKQWDPVNFQLIPAALENLQNEIRREKQNLYPSVVPFYLRAVESLRIHFRAITSPSLAKLSLQAG
jgi:CHAD domain-containing protein